MLNIAVNTYTKTLQPTYSPKDLKNGCVYKVVQCHTNNSAPGTIIVVKNNKQIILETKMPGYSPFCIVGFLKMKLNSSK